MRTIPLTKGFVALVDDEDYEHIAKHRWYARKGKNGVAYAQRFVGRRSVQMHREIVGAVAGQVVDHREHPTGVVDNRKENLRICTHLENCYNTSGRVRIHSRYKGVTYSNYGARRWLAGIGVGGKRIYLGRFACETAAALAYDRASLRLHGEYGRRNILKEVSRA